MEIKVISSDEYASLYAPAPGWVLVKKDALPEKRGAIIVPQSVKERVDKYSGTGVIMALGSAKCADEHDGWLIGKYCLGDRVGFSSAIPHMAPAPPWYEFKNSDGEKDLSVIIHVADILGVLCDTVEERIAAAEMLS